jgi:Kef-type K+ transport system membrane component KefB
MLDWSSLLSCMMMSCVFANTSRLTDKIFEPLDRMTPPIYMMFFILAGASLDITIIPKIGLIGVCYVLFRVVGKFLGAYIGATISHAPAVVKKYLGLTLVPQEGVAIGLVTVAKANFPKYGGTIQTVVLCGIVIYELVGPLITKKALKAAGEIQV